MITSPGEAEAILAKAKATAEGLAVVSKTLKEHGGVEVRFPNLFHWMLLVCSYKILKSFTCFPYLCTASVRIADNFIYLFNFFF